MSHTAQELHAAVEHLDWTAVVAMLRSGLSIDAGDEQGNSPLAVACRAGRMEAVRKLIQFGANVEAANDAGHTPLNWAVLAEEPEAVQALLKAHARVNTVTGVNAYTVLHWALAKPPRDPDKVGIIVQNLLEAGSEANHKSRDGTTPLMHAAWYGVERAASILLERGADPQMGDNRGRNALALANERGHENIAKLLQSVITAAQNRKPESAVRKFVRWWKAEDK
jgi:uncharacterized protein